MWIFIHSYYEFKLFGVTLSINTTMVTTVIVCLILLALILFARHEIMKDYDEPNVVQNVVEMIVEKMDAMVVSNMGIHAKKYLNYVEALMAFIFLSIFQDFSDYGRQRQILEPHSVWH